MADQQRDSSSATRDALIPEALLHDTEVRLERALAALKLAQAELRASELRFRQLAENISEVFWLTDPSKERIAYVSPAYETIWGRKRGRLRASPADWIAAIHPDDRGRVEAAARERQVSGEYDEEYRIIRPDGEIRWIRDRAFPVRDASKAVVLVAGIAEDITTRKELEARLDQATAALSIAAQASHPDGHTP